MKSIRHYIDIIERQLKEATRWHGHTSNPHLGSSSRIRAGQDPNIYYLVDVNTGKKFSKDGVPVEFSTIDHARAVANKLKWGDWEPVPAVRD